MKRKTDNVLCMSSLSKQDEFKFKNKVGKYTI